MNAAQSVNSCGEDIKVTKSFPNFDNMVHNNGGVIPGSHLIDWPAPWRYELAHHEYMVLTICRQTKIILIFVTCAPSYCMAII